MNEPLDLQALETSPDLDAALRDAFNWESYYEATDFTEREWAMEF